MFWLLLLLLQLNFGYRTYTNPRYRYIRWVERPETTENTPIYRGKARPSYRYPSNYNPHQLHSRDLSYSSYTRKEDHLKTDLVKVETNFQDISDQISAAVRTNACPSDVPIDILFLLDSSYMTTSTAYSQFKRLVAYMASTMMYSDSMVKMAVFQFDEAQTERFISFHDYEEFSSFKTSLSNMKRKQLGRKGRHTSRRTRRFSHSLRRRFQRNSARMDRDPFESALDSVKKYGFSRARGARPQAVKILIVMSSETPTYTSIELATKLRSFHDINIFAVAVGERAGMTDEFTGSAERILRVFKENRLVDELAQLQQLVCRDFERCSTSSFQCLKKYNTGGYAGSYITNCHRINCDNGKCLTKPCHPSQFCEEKGAYDFECSTSSFKNQLTCDDLSCANGLCKMLGQTAHCQCHAGWTGDTCKEDVDECLISSHNCQHECINTSGGYKCECDEGYLLTVAGQCQDIDECSKSKHGCHQICRNYPGEYRCECYPGFSLHSDGYTCSEIDTCKLAGCSDKCVNLPGLAYRCQCSEGFILDNDDHTCIDVNECALEPCEYGYECINTSGSYKCVDIDECTQAHCSDGFSCKSFKGDFKCYDINECESSPCNKNENCENTVGGFVCSVVDPCAENPCEEGFTCRTNESGFECLDIDECEKNNICPVGYRCENYRGDYECVDIDECQEYSPCAANHKCENTNGAYTCLYVDPCESIPCTDGFICESKVDGSYKCIDIDECANEPCKNNQECTNLHGGYRCDDMDECKSQPCASGFKCTNLYPAYDCIDIDECTEGLSTCTERQACQNTEGSFKCVDLDPCEDIQCDTGFECIDYMHSFECLDINECAIDSPCELGYSCKNTPGSFICEDFNECDVFGEINICDIGFTCVNNVGNFSCVDVDECLEIGSCPVGFECFNRHGSYDCLDKNECFDEPCEDGYACLNNEGSYTCVDVNECNVESCPPGTNCVNTLGSYECTDVDECEDSPCDKGFYCSNSFGSFDCHDVDECSSLTSPCDEFSKCVNTPGSFECEKIKEARVGETALEEVSTCEESKHKCSHTCILLSTNNITIAPSTPIHIAAPNVYYRCDCPNGFELAQNGHTCVDIDECTIRKGGCSDYCFNSQGSYSCVCGEGKKLSSDMHTCTNLFRNSNDSPCMVQCANGNCIGDVCKCADGWTGSHCDQEITACKGGCLNGGKCKESKEERNECQCTDRYYGRSCSKLRSVPNVCRDQAFDLVFLIDGSIRIGRKNYNMVIDWVKSIVAQLNISQERSRVGLVQFSTKTEIEFDLARFNDKKNLLQGLEQSKSRFKNMGYNAYAGLRNSIDLFHGENPRFLIMITAGRLYIHPRRQKEVLNAAEHSKVEIFAVKLGKMSNEAELMGLTKNDRNIYGIRHKSDFRKEGAAILTSVCFKDDWRSKIIED